MKATLKTLILTILALGVMLSSCDTPAKRLQQARALYEEGTELRQQRLSEEAAERFLQALTLMQGCEPTTENFRLKGHSRSRRLHRESTLLQWFHSLPHIRRYTRR